MPFPKSVCFFAKVPDPEVLERVEFYAEDIRALRELGREIGFDLHIVTRWQDLRRADLYFIWWWSYALPPLALAFLQRSPVVIAGVFSHLLPDGTWEIFKERRLARWIKSLGMRLADANLFASKLECENLPRVFSVSNPQYSPHGIDTSFYTPDNKDRENLILTISWLQEANVRRKCITEVIKAAALIHQSYPDYKFVIAGEHGSAYKNLTALIRGLNAESYISLPGSISKEEKISYLQKCKLYLQPTTTEGFGLAILEAMSCGATVVSSAVGTVPEVAGDTAAFVNGRLPEDIAQTVCRLLGDESLRAEMGRRARERAETMFSRERRKRDIQRVIVQLLAAKGADVQPVQETIWQEKRLK